MRPGTEPALLDALKTCVRQSLGIASTAIEQETLAHLVNGGIHRATPDSMRKILGNDQLVEALTHTEFHGADTIVSIYYRTPRKDVFTHELANALVARHRAVLLGAEPLAQTSRFYRTCVSYCPRCTGAY
jgi:hypothetical protein